MRNQTFEAGPFFISYLALVIGTTTVSTGAIFARLADAPALVIAACRLALATSILAPATGWKVRDDILKLQ